MAENSGAGGGEALTHTAGDVSTSAETTLDLRVASILIILVAGLLGALSPLHVKAWRDPHNLLQRLTRSFSAGAILALAIIHVMPDAYEALSKSMQEERGQITGGSTVLLGIFAMVLIESMANQMLCPSSQSPVHVHGCNQYHASSSKPASKMEPAGALSSDEDASQPLLAADMLGEAGVHASVHVDAHQGAEQEGDGTGFVEGHGQVHAAGAAASGSCDASEGGQGAYGGVVGGKGTCKSGQQRGLCGGLGARQRELCGSAQSGPAQSAVGVESKAEAAVVPAGLAGPSQACAGSQCSSSPQQAHTNGLSHTHTQQGGARARAHPLHFQFLQGQLQQHGHQHHNKHEFLHLPHQQHQQQAGGHECASSQHAHAQHSKHSHGHVDDACAIPVEEHQAHSGLTIGHANHHQDHHHHHHHHGACGHSHTHRDQRQSLQRRVMAYMLELGCVFHSLFIGLSLGVTVEGRPQVYALVIALAVHQLLEGLALGSVVAAANFGKYSGMSMAVMYSLTTPIGVALGIMASSYQSSSVGLTVQGLANAASAGMLLYIALVQLITEHNKYVALQYSVNEQGAAHEGPTTHSAPSRTTLPVGPASVLNVHSSRHQRICFVPVTVVMSHAALVAGATLMWVMGFWS